MRSAGETTVGCFVGRMHMYVTSIHMFLLLLLFTCARFFASASSPIPVDKLDIAMYLGDWYQIYGSPTNVVFQGYGKCITANYGALSGSENVSVLNSQLNRKGELETISGYAYYTNTSEPGKLTVHLDGTPVDAPYWVVSLGEVKRGQYQYSIVTSPSGISLWVLARNVREFLREYDTEVREFLEMGGYKYTAIEQGCRNTVGQFRREDVTES
jgi:lipocalin